MARYLPLIIFAVFLITACEQKEIDLPIQPRTIKVVEVGKSEKARQRILPARIEYSDSTALSFERSGRIEWLDIRQGTPVAKGQVIARLSSDEARQRVKERQTTADLAQRQFERFQALSARHAVSRDEMDVQRAKRDAANAALQIAREELNQMILTAPFSGIAVSVNARSHQVATAGQTIATLARTDMLDVAFSVPENLFTAMDIRNVTYRPLVQITALPGRQFQADYKEHSASSNNNTLTWKMILTMPRPSDFPAVAGVSGTVTIDLSKLPVSTLREKLVVPVEAVFNPDNSPLNHPHVWVVKGSGEQLTLEERSVTTGELTEGGIVITHGLTNGERVVAAGVNEIHAQQQIRIWTREGGL